MTTPIVWSIAGTDSGGGAGLSADQRACDAFGVHLCPVVAAVTAQHSTAVRHVEPMPAALIEAQLRALAEDMPPRAIKTGLLGGAAQIAVVARWVDRLRQEGDVALVVDPVLASSAGARFADGEALAAYRAELLPRATVITPNRGEAHRLLDEAASHEAAALPSLARRLLGSGAQAVCITGGDSATAEGRVLDWLACEHARGWLASPRVETSHRHGTGCTFASSIAAALALGFVAADAAVLAKMATTRALRAGQAAGKGAGPVRADSGFIDPSLLPLMSWGESPLFAAPRDRAQRRLDLYGIVDSADRVVQLLEAGVRTVQLRMKTLERAREDWPAFLRDSVRRSMSACRAAGAELFINDHWRIALELGAPGVHLGQEDLLALGDCDRADFIACGLSVGISSHSLWELCRARGTSPRYIACGPVWPTLTKAMPWRPQGLRNLSWWQHMAGVPVVAIGGILEAAQVQAAAACGVDGVCVVRALEHDLRRSVLALKHAFDVGRAGFTDAATRGLPVPSLAQIASIR
ncbi:MAG: bifunctional hydroxymethylpyrimidine kinase/phosphomethylpyrimidine kinase [Caldimonas sp.]